MTTAVTSHDVAREAGVSQPTVSRALRGDPRISESTRLRVLEAALKLSYTPNALAKSLTTNRTFAVGLVIENVGNAFYSMLVDAVYNELALKGYRMLLFQERPGARVENDLARLLLGRALDGALFTAGTADKAPIDALLDKKLPIVLLNRYFEKAKADLVISDNVDGAGLVAKHLLELGHRRIGLITGPQHAATSRDRERGFRTILEAAGFPLDDRLRREGRFSHHSGYQLCLELLHEKHPPSAIFCQTDMIALGAMNAATKQGVEVPRQLSIAGFDDVEMADWEAFGLTTVRQPVARMAEMAVRMLLDRIEQRHTGPPRTETFPTTFIKRTSTAPPNP